MLVHFVDDLYRSTLVLFFRCLPTSFELLGTALDFERPGPHVRRRYTVPVMITYRTLLVKYRLIINIEYLSSLHSRRHRCCYQLTPLTSKRLAIF